MQCLVDTSESSFSGWQWCTEAQSGRKFRMRGTCALSRQWHLICTFSFLCLIKISSIFLNLQIMLPLEEKQGEIHWKVCYHKVLALSLCAAGHVLTCWNFKSHPCEHSCKCVQASASSSNAWWSIACWPPETAGIALLINCFSQPIFWESYLSGIILINFLFYCLIKGNLKTMWICNWRS